MFDSVESVLILKIRYPVDDFVPELFISLAVNLMILKGRLPFTSTLVAGDVAHGGRG